jgi:ribosomal protein S12 methylthiotransferase accessory factor
MPTLAQYSFGTERLVPPAATLARIEPFLERCGITRVTSVTGLDSLGIPTYCSIRPAGLLLQVSNGKGLTDAAAKVSAAMEALELHHAENPLPWRLRRASVAELRAEGAEIIDPRDIHGFRTAYFGERFVCDWVLGEWLGRHGQVWAPASAIYFFCTPGLHDTNTNGLASGNHDAEATLHALYELVERDAMAQLIVEGTLRIREGAAVLDTRSVDHPAVRALIDQMEAADTKVVLLSLPSAVAVPTFWAVLLNTRPHAAVSTINLGWGTHADMHIAAARALTEAAQSRLTFIHGAREDLRHKQVYHAAATEHSRPYAYFEALQPTTTWAAIAGAQSLGSSPDLEAQLTSVVAALHNAGHDRLARFDLTDPDVGIPVVKVIAPSLRFREKLF